MFISFFKSYLFLLCVVHFPFLVRRQDENVGSVVKRGKTDERFAYLPITMFQLKNNVKKRGENIKDRKYKCLIDGCSKIICVAINSRSNAKRHVKVNLEIYNLIFVQPLTLT